MTSRVAQRLIPSVRIPLTPLRRTSDFQSDAPLSRLIESLIRTRTRTRLWGTCVTPGFSYAPRVTRTPALLIRSHRTRRVDTLLRGVSRGDALADVHRRGLATPHSGQASGQGVN